MKFGKKSSHKHIQIELHRKPRRRDLELDLEARGDREGMKNCRAKQAIIYLEDTEKACQAKEMGKCWGKSKRWATIGEWYQTMMFPKFQTEDYILYL